MIGFGGNVAYRKEKINPSIEIRMILPFQRLRSNVKGLCLPSFIVLYLLIGDLNATPSREGLLHDSPRSTIHRTSSE